MNERDEDLLEYIQDEAILLLKMTNEYDLNRFKKDEMAQNAVCMILIKIGESVKLRERAKTDVSRCQMELNCRSS